MSLAIAGRPTNLRIPGLRKRVVVEHDVHGVCDELAEEFPNVYIVLAEDFDGNHAFHIMERADDGVDYLCFKVDELDKRVVDRLKRIANIPFAERYAAAEKEEQEAKAAADEAASEELYERMGGPMYTQLAKDGFIDRRTSYPIVRPRKWRQ